MPTGTLLAGFITSLAISLLAIPSIVKVARHKGLFAIDREKKAGTKKIPTLGGLAIFAGTIFSISIYTDITAMPQLPYIIAGAVVLFFIGLKDDILVTAPLWKLLAQILVALIIAMPAGMRIHEPFHGLGLTAHHEALEVLVTVLVIVMVLNSFNLIDGIDGLAAGTGMLCTLVFSMVFYREGLWEWALMAVVMCGSLAGFAWFNVFGRRNKILMGDTGSLLLGFILALLMVRFLDLENPGLWKRELQSPVTFVLAVLSVPLFDTLRIILVRLLHGQSPLHADRKHIHYRMVDLGFTHIQASGILVGINTALIILALALQEMGEIKGILLLLVISGLLSFIPGWFLRKRKNKHTAENSV